MAGEGVNVKVLGLPDLKAALLAVAPKLRRKALREALRAGAGAVRAAARRAAPVLKTSTFSGASALRRGVRKVGTLRKAISVRTSKISTRRGNVGVFVNVRPAKGKKTMRVQVYHQRGRLVSRGQFRGSSRDNPDDPYYWRWINFGWNPASGGNTLADKRRRRKINDMRSPKTKGGYRFLEEGAKALNRALEIFTREIGPRIAKLNQGKNAQP